MSIQYDIYVHWVELWDREIHAVKMFEKHVFILNSGQYVNLNFMIFNISHDVVLEPLYLTRSESVSLGYYRHDIHLPVHALHEL